MQDQTGGVRRTVGMGLGRMLAALAALAGCGVRPVAGPALHHGASLLEPPDDRVYHGWGQVSGYWNWDDPVAANDIADLDSYVAAVSPNAPAMISFYVAPVEDQVTGFLARYPALVRERPFFIAQVALYFMDEPLHRKVASGEADGELRRLFEGLKAAGRPVLLRIGYEFNGHDHPYDPTLYPEAFRRVARLAREIAPGLIATVWHAEPEGFRDRDFHVYDPGDEFVDWWGLSVFFPEFFTDEGLHSFLDEAAKRGKPVLIAECSPWFRGSKDNPVRAPGSLEEVRSWYDSLFGLTAAHPQIKGLSVIVVDWTRWNTKFAEIPGGLPDVRFDRWAGLKEHYARSVAEPRFIHSPEAGRMLTSP